MLSPNLGGTSLPAPLLPLPLRRRRECRQIISYRGNPGRRFSGMFFTAKEVKERRRRARRGRTSFPSQAAFKKPGRIILSISVLLALALACGVSCPPLVLRLLHPGSQGLRISEASNQFHERSTETALFPWAEVDFHTTTMYN